MSAEEKTHSRPSDLSLRHRMYGRDTPVCDLDGIIWCEYDRSVPVALVEYKHANANLDNIHHNPNVRAIQNLAAMGDLYAFVAAYDPDPDLWTFRVISLNTKTTEALGKPERLLSERRYVEFLHVIRGIVAPPDLLDSLNNIRFRVADDD